MASYKFRVLIDTDKSEEIFRDIVISSTENFEAFYFAILGAYEFSGQELGSFYVSNNEWDKGHEIALMDMQLSDNLDSPSIMKETIVQDLVTSSTQKFIMVYDFLRMWCFLIELVELLDENTLEPRIELSVGIAPREDSREIDLSGGLAGSSSMELGNDFDDIFSEDMDDDEDFEGFENIDDMDF